MANEGHVMMTVVTMALFMQETHLINKNAYVTHTRDNNFQKTIHTRENMFVHFQADIKVLFHGPRVLIYILNFFFSLMLNVPVNNFSITFMSCVGTEPPLPGYYQYFCSRTQHGDMSGARTPDL